MAKTPARKTAAAAGGDVAAADRSGDAADDTATDQATGAAAAGTAAAPDESTERLADQVQRPAVALPAGQASYRVISPLNHNLRDYDVGSDITLTDAQAERLLGHTVERKNAPQEEA